MPNSGEFAIIERYFSRRSARPDVLLGVGDDAAALRVPADQVLVAAIDTIVAGTHFPDGTPPADIGHRALAVNLSDLAAMGAQPAWALLSLSLPVASGEWLEQFAAGFYAIADRYQVSLVGGDTVHGPLVVTVQILGFADPAQLLTRSGARPGDYIYVTGVPGEAAGGLAVIQRNLQGSDGDYLRQRFLRPEPRVAAGIAARKLAHAAMDVSDGLLGDLTKLCSASGCRARVELESLPQSRSMHALFDDAECERLALAGGDDYELLFTVSPELAARFEADVGSTVRCTRIGTIVGAATRSDVGVDCYRHGVRVSVDALSSYDHFAPPS